LRGALEQRFDVSVSGRTLSIPAPDESRDLERIAAVVRESGVPIDELALRRPTLDDAFLALTGQPPSESPEGASDEEEVAA
jgi:hypothetical protein